ncbi:hypothetical protein CQW23_05501 [Capsicum baccatum]|uniref:Uncharacterized protein n=1 Tax=Capsicum baccatum TaxID=33114 RepID=A0A2G2XHQ4_CAPBA|nr:hypothetical protein CQW23_05501 [Capsicum baccatum]
MSSITILNETIHGIMRRVKRISLPFLTETQKNQLTSPFFIDLGEKKPSTSWEARHQVSGFMRITKLTRQSWLLAQQGGALPHLRWTRGSVRGGASGFQCTASKIRTSLPADHCYPILEGAGA